MRKMTDRLLRRIVPAASRLSYNPVFKLVVDTFDSVPRMIWPEFRPIPPNHMRIRVGSRRLFTNHLRYLLQAEHFWLFCFAKGLVHLNSNIVDIGSGCGRYAHHLRDFRLLNSRYCGRYTGIDVDPEMLAWCAAHFDSPRFSFFHSPHASKSYNQTGSSSYCTLPVGDNSTDFVFSTSLFTHLLEPELVNYCEESLRVLKPGGSMLMYCFCLDYPPPTLGGRHSFRHSLGNASVESLKVPEAAVAYSEQFLISRIKSCGFHTVNLIGMSDSVEYQSAILARKAVD
jgi:SAM-dependent methyltransferase